MEKITYQGKMIEVVEAPVTMSGVTKTFEYARRSPGVRLIIPRDGSVLISKEFRHELNGYDYRLPGGKVYDTLVEYNDALSSGADIAVAAQAAAVKEAQEEVGVGVEEAQIFHRSVCGASVVWDLYYFVVSRFSEGERHAEAGEDISHEWLPAAEVQKMCLDGRISEERSALVLLRYLANLSL